MVTQTHRIAFFDFDGTITRRDTFIQFMLKYVPMVKVLYALLLTSPFIIGYKLGLYSNDKAKNKLFRSLFKGVDLRVFQKWGEDFSKDIENNLNTSGLKRLNNHILSGDVVYIVSASISTWIKPWAQKNGVKKVISTEIEVDKNNKLTGNFSTPNCNREEKARRIIAEIPDIEKYETFSYGDSSGDTAMFELTNHHTVIKNEKN